jgi:cold shock CspA family protein
VKAEDWVDSPEDSLRRIADAVEQIARCLTGRLTPTDQPNGTRKQGIVRSVLPEKGFGFIVADGGDYFFHRSAAPDYDRLQIGTAVTFESHPDNGKGPRAERVRLV